MKRARGSVDVPPGIGSNFATYVVDSVIAHVEAGDARLRVLEVIETHARIGATIRFLCSVCKLPVFHLEKDIPVWCHKCDTSWCGRDYYCKLKTPVSHPTCGTCKRKTCGIDVVECSHCEKVCCSRGLQTCCQQNICDDCLDEGRCPMCGEDLIL
jgi:hypothetical protein